jgi:hypothetical protein
VALWRAHLDLVLSTVDLTPVQRSFILSAKENVPAYLQADADTVREFDARASQVLGRDLTLLAFHKLGDMAKPASAGTADCSCTSNDGCASHHVCKDTDCMPAKACGPFNDEWCYGQCFAPQ